MLLLLTHGSSDCNFFLSVVCVIFPGDFIFQNGLLFPTLLVMYADTFLGLLFSPCRELCLLLCFGDAADCLESFWP